MAKTQKKTERRLIDQKARLENDVDKLEWKLFFNNLDLLRIDTDTAELADGFASLWRRLCDVDENQNPATADEARNQVEWLIDRANEAMKFIRDNFYGPRR
jgi:hypothetical protein